MNTMSKNKLAMTNENTNNSLISDILRKSSIHKSISTPSTNNSFILQNILKPSFLKEYDNVKIFKSISLNNKTSKTSTNSQTTELIKTANSIQSTSTDISDKSSNSPVVQLNKSANSFIKNFIIKQIDTNENKLNLKLHDESELHNESELITNTKLVINLKKETTDTIKKETTDTIKNISLQHIYDSSSDDLIILANLSFLSKIEPDQKIFVVYNENNKINFELKIDSSYIPKLTRWYYSQGRNETIYILKKLIELSIKQYNIHQGYNNTVEISNYKILLQKSILGLNNFKITYNSDITILEELDLIIVKIKEIIN
jgi:hypothetical protein